MWPPTKLLATVGWKRGCQPFCCRCLQNVTHCRKEICLTCLSKEDILAIPFWNSKHPLPTSSFRYPRAAVRSTSSALWMHHAHPFVAAAEQETSHVEKQRVWSRSCRLHDLLHTIQWLCSHFCYVTAANQWTFVEIEFLASVGWKRGCQPFSCPCSLNVTHWKELFSTCLPKESMPFVNSKPPFPARSLKSLRAAVRSTSSAWWLHHACKK